MLFWLITKRAPWSLVDSFDDVDKKAVGRQTHSCLDSTTFKLLRARDQVNKKAKRSGLSHDWTEYKRLRNKVSEINREPRTDYFKNKLEKYRGKLKAFLDTLRLLLPSKKKCNEIEKLVVGLQELSDKRTLLIL
ncbi:Hypothetical predicted protein [Paramuricea clavata]|uniref:Uncharacterized protein n=1 Tax=Paramuricea clavata TaxID=317549 RepID=A0A7D9ERD0_PARCT|nr:Hypothetical predicted protein [Paramuricea clavata]